MAAVCRFVDEEHVRARRAGCPLAVLPPSPDERACAGCPWNAAWPGEATIGCRVAVPGRVWRAATASLAGQPLFDELHALRGRDLDGADLQAAAAVVARWRAVADKNGDDDSREAAGVAAAFLRAAAQTGSGVRLWE